MATDYYNENAERAGEWLRNNAPDYVLNCLEAWGRLTIAAVEIIKENEQTLAGELENKRVSGCLDHKTNPA